MECIEKEAADDSLPTEKLVGLTTDRTSVMVSARGGLYGKLKQAVNSKLFLNDCPPHRLILALKAGQKVLPGDIEKTVADMLYFFKDSSVRCDEFHSLKELVEPNSQYIALVQYHRVRWLSFSDCVSRLVKLLPLLVRYFEEQALYNRQEVRAKCRSLHSQLSEPRFQLFLFFLEPQLEVLAKLNKWLQTSSLSLLELYSKIKALLSTFVKPISLDVTKSITDSAKVRCLEEAVPFFLGTDFQQHYLQCQDHALLTTAQLNAASKVMYDYIYKIAVSIEKRFPEIDFMLTNTAFLEPPLRNLQQLDMQAMLKSFWARKWPRCFPIDKVIMQFRFYQNDSSIDIQFSACKKDPVVFWCQLYEEGDYKELASLALLLLSISPTSVLCERGFSTMNYVKNEFRSLLTQENLNACMSLGMTLHSVRTFPFRTFLKK